MKILFLDIDGVINTKESMRKGVHFPIDPYCAFLVGKIKLDTGCDVVLSSSWRHLDDGYAEVEKRVVPLRGKTGSCCSGIRGVEIYNWMRDNIPGFDSTHKGDFRFAILDDDSDMLLWQKDHFFQTSFTEGGLTEEIANKVIEHLNK